MDFDATQAINLSDFEETTEEEGDGNKIVLGYLKVFTNRGFVEKVFPVYEGDNYIGRDEQNEITVPVKSLSKQHACIEVQADTHLIHDLGSRNKSRKGKLFLKPNVRYNIQHDEKFLLADMSCQYYYASQYKNPDETNSGSDTDSELMLDGVDSDPVLALPQSDKEKDVSADSDGLDISDCIMPTQAAPSDSASPQRNKTLSMKTPAAPRPRGVLAAESDEEDNDRKDAADVSRVEDSGSDTDDDVYNHDTEDFTVASDDLAMAATQACFAGELAPTQPIKKTKTTLSYDPDSDSDDDDVAIAPTQACAPTQPAVITKTKKTLSFGPGSDSESGTDDERGRSLFFAETQAVAVGGDTSDQDDDSNGDRGKSLFEAATQAVTGVQSDSDRDDDDDRGVSLYEAATQALHYSDSADETVSSNKRVSIASTVMLNESSDLESSTKKPRPSMSPTKLSMLKASKSTPGRKDSLEVSFVFEKPAEKKKLTDISHDLNDPEDTEVDESFDELPFSRDDKDETLPCSEDDFMAETQEVSDYEEQLKHSDQDQDTGKGDAEEDEHSSKANNKIEVTDKAVGNNPVPGTSNTVGEESVHPDEDEPGTEREAKTSLVYLGADEEQNGVDPTAPYDLPRTLSEQSKDSGPQSAEGMTVAPTVPYQLNKETTVSSSGSIDNPLETVVEPIGACKTIADEGESIIAEGGDDDNIGETQAYTGDPGELATIGGSDEKQDGKETSGGQAETQAYGEVSDTKKGKRDYVGQGKVKNGRSALSDDSEPENRADRETLAYGTDLDDEGKMEDQQRDNGEREAGQMGEDVETQAFGADVETTETVVPAFESGDDKVFEETQAYGVELDGAGTDGTPGASAGENAIEETQAYGLDGNEVDDLSGIGMKKVTGRETSEEGHILEDASERVEETQFLEEEEKSVLLPEGGATKRDRQLAVEETQAYGMEEVVGETLGLGMSGKDTDDTDNTGLAVSRIKEQGNSDGVEETQAYGLEEAITSGPVGDLGGPSDPMGVGATQPYGTDDKETDGEVGLDRAERMEVEETQAYGTTGGTMPTLAYGGESGETQIPDSQEMEPVMGRAGSRDDVFAGVEVDGTPTDGTDHPDMVETDAAPQRGKSGDEGLLKKARSEQSLKDMDKPDRGGLLSSLKKKVRFGKKKKRSVGSDSGGSTRSSRSSTGGKDEEESVGDAELEEPESLSLLDGAVLEEEESVTEPAPPKRRRIATIERPDLATVRKSGRKRIGAKEERGEPNPKDSEKKDKAKSDDGRRPVRQRRDATVDRPDLGLLTTPERESGSSSQKTGSSDSPDGPEAQVVDDKGKNESDANNNRRGKRGARSKVTQTNKDPTSSEDKNLKGGKDRDGKGTRGKAKAPVADDGGVSGKRTRRGRTAMDEEKASSSLTKEDKEGKHLVVELEPMTKEELGHDTNVSPREEQHGKGNSSPDGSVVTADQTTGGQTENVSDLGIDSTVKDTPVRLGRRGRTRGAGVKDTSENVLSTPQKRRGRTKGDEPEAPVRKSSRRGRLGSEGDDHLQEASLDGEKTQNKIPGANVSSDKSGNTDSAVTSTTPTTSTTSTRGTRKRGASEDSEDGSVQESPDKKKTDDTEVEASSQSTRNRQDPKGTDRKSDSVPSKETKTSKGTGSRKGSTEEKGDTDTATDLKDPETTSRRGARNRKPAKNVTEVVTNSPKPAASSSRGRRKAPSKKEEVTVSESAEPVASSKRGSRRRNTSADSNSSIEVSQETQGTKRGRGASAEDEDSISSTVSLDSVPGKEDRFAQPTPVKGRRGRGRGRAPALKVEDASLTSSEGISPAMEDESTTKKGRGKGAKTTDKLAALELVSTPSRSTAKRSIGRTPLRTPRSSPTPLDASSPSLRRRSSEPRPKVMFTGVIDKSGEKVVSSLGGILTDSVFECTHLVTDKVRRTVKFLCCLSRGAQIVTPVWLEQSKIQQRFVDPAEFLLVDKDSEKQYKFSLLKSHERAKESNLLAGWRIHATPGVKPDPTQMRDIIRSAGGEFLSRVPCQHQDSTVVISCEDDSSKCLAAVAADIPLVTAEFLLTGLLRQQIDIDSYRLPVNATKTAKSSTPAKKTAPKSRSRRR